jgi:hypothetical protein
VRPDYRELREVEELQRRQGAQQAARAKQAGSSGGFVVHEERLMLELPRGKKGEALRLTFTKATSPDGKPVAWHSLRVYYTDAASGEKRPTKTGVTIRGAELVPVLRALATAAGARLVKSQPDDGGTP